MLQTDTKTTLSENHGRPVIEWVLGGISAIVVSGLIVFLAYEALFGDNSPPRLVVSVDRIEQIGNGTLVTVSVSNDGDEAASAVMVVASTSGDERQKTIELDYIAAHAVRRGAFIFDTTSLSENDIRLEIGGFVEP
ncbi:hypothetical protein ABFT80_27785 [Mesorhizobium sp. SB112]|uniref:hypothetical protein n=1 Tax=Mesorhizobium sp. SB112 TaxID=3151853 RepID=UPI003266901D